MKTVPFADLKHKMSPARRAELARAAKAMHNPPHPGEFITAMYLEPHGISGRQLAAKLNVAPSTLNRILLGTSAVSPEMALRLAKTLGRSPESWLSLQHNYDLGQARRRVDLASVSPLKVAAA